MRTRSIHVGGHERVHEPSHPHRVRSLDQYNIAGTELFVQQCPGSVDIGNQSGLLSPQSFMARAGVYRNRIRTSGRDDDELVDTQPDCEATDVVMCAHTIGPQLTQLTED